MTLLDNATPSDSGPWTDGLLLGFDLETTSAGPETALPVQIGTVMCLGGEVTKTEAVLVNPGVPIPSDATAVHGITDEMVADALSLDEGMDSMLSFLSAAATGGNPVVGMNLSFDLTLADRCARRFGGDRDRLRRLVCLDLLVLDRWLDKYRKGKRTLTAIAEHYGVPPFAAHGADEDARATVLAVLALAERYPEIAKTRPETLHSRQVVAHRSWATGFSDYRVRRGDPPLAAADGDWPIRRLPTRSAYDDFVSGTAETLSRRSGKKK